MVPRTLIQYSERGSAIVPHYLREHDHPWLRALLDLYEGFAGRRRRELDERLREPLPVEVSAGKLRLAIHVLDRATGNRCRSAVPPRKARAAVFGAAAGGGRPEEVLTHVARSLDVGAEELRESLFADLPGERRVVPPPRTLSPSELALRSNLAMAQAIVCRAAIVRIESEGNSRSIVRHAKLRGLLCTVERRRGAECPVLEISGPFAIFRRTIVYGRALAGLVPLLAWCRRFTLRADCALDDKRLSLLIRTGDPIFPALEPRRFDSKLEERFARAFLRIAPDWELLREPEPIEVGNSLIFPDFLLRHRHEPERQWLLEIVGFWTPEYVSRKLRALRAAGLRNLILCIDQERNCSAEDIPDGAPVIRYRRRIDLAEVLRIIEPASVVTPKR